MHVWTKNEPTVHLIKYIDVCMYVCMYMKLWTKIQEGQIVQSDQYSPCVGWSRHIHHLDNYIQDNSEFFFRKWLKSTFFTQSLYKSV